MSSFLVSAVFCAAEDLSSDVNTPVVVTENDIIRDLMRRDVKWGPPSTGDKPTMVSVSLKLTAVTEVVCLFSLFVCLLVA